MQLYVQFFDSRHRAATIVQSFFVLHFDESTLDYPHRQKSHFPSGLKGDFKVCFIFVRAVLIVKLRTDSAFVTHLAAIMTDGYFWLHYGQIKRGTRIFI